MGSMVTVHKLLNASGGQLARLVRRCQARTDLETVFRRTLPDNLASHLALGHYDNGVLIVLAASAAWATRLRFECPDVESKLRGTPAFSQLKAIQIKVRRRMAEDSGSRVSAPRCLSKSASKTVNAAADSMPPGLVRDALLRLASLAPDNPTEGR